MALSDRRVTVTLRYPLATWDYGEDALLDGPVIPIGAAVTLSPTPGVTVIHQDPYGDADNRTLLLAGAKSPCPDFAEDVGDSGPPYFQCDRFCQTSGTTDICLGDRCRCPSSKVRAEARVALRGKGS